MLNTTIPTQYVAILADIVRQHRGAAHRTALDTPDLFAGTDLSYNDLTSFDTRIQFADFIPVVGNAYRITQDPALGLHFGQRLNLSSHATLGHALMNCVDFNQALQLFLKFYHIIAPNLELSYEERDGRFYLTPEWRMLDFNPHFSHEFLFASILTSVRFLLNRDTHHMRLELPYPAPAHVAEYQEMFGDEVFFDCDRSRVSMALEVLQLPLPTSNPVLLDLYEKECERLLADLQEGATISARTLEVLRRLEGQYPQADSVAALMNFSPRTYRRRLASEGNHYQELLDKVRAEQAIHHLTHTRLPTSSIAYMLGFNDVSNFRRAFIKWTGTSPKEARKQAISNSSSRGSDL